jgi:hypothetical protein
MRPSAAHPISHRFTGVAAGLHPSHERPLPARARYAARARPAANLLPLQ